MNVSDLSLSPLNMGGGTPDSARLLWPLALSVGFWGAVAVAPIISDPLISAGGAAAISGGGNVTFCPSENFELFSL